MRKRFWFLTRFGPGDLDWIASIDSTIVRVHQHGATLPDKGYTSRANRSWLAARGIKAIIPEKSDQAANRERKGSAGGRPPAFDSDAYNGRNVVERGFNRLKNWRGVAMRSDKTARNYLAAVQLAASLVC